MNYLLSLVLLAFAGAIVPGEEVQILEAYHRVVRFEPQQLDYLNFDYPTTVEGQRVDLRDYAKGKRLLLVTYFAAWCENSEHDFVTIRDLQHKFQSEGLAVIAVCNYSDRDEIDNFMKKNQPTYPVCIETLGVTEREKTLHYGYRRRCGDDRKWGTPFTLLIEAKNIKSDGQILAAELFAAKGELEKKNAEKLIAKLLK